MALNPEFVGRSYAPTGSYVVGREKLREFASDDTPVWSADLRGVTARHTLGALLPASFGTDHLGSS